MKTKVRLLLSFVAVIAVAGSGIAQTFPGQGDKQAWIAASGMNNQGIAFLAAGRFDEAIATFNQAIATYAFDASFYGNLGLAKQRKGSMAEAEANFDQAIRLNPSDWVYWSDLGVLFHTEKRFKESKEALTQALKRMPPVKDETRIQNNIKALDREISSSSPSPSP